MKSGAAALLLCTAEIAATAIYPVHASATEAVEAEALYKDAKAPVDARVNDLLAKMTLEEKSPKP